MEEVILPLEGTRLGRQEVHAEILDDNSHALWLRGWIADHRITNVGDEKATQAIESLQTVATAVDPSGTATGDEAGIVTAGRSADGHFFVLDDLSVRTTPEQWAQRTIAAYHKRRASTIVAEANYGGGMVRATLRAVDSMIPIRLVNATRGKAVRAEPVSALYERGLVHHVGIFPELEDELCEWEPGKASPNRLDALVWVITYLMGNTARRARSH